MSGHTSQHASQIAASIEVQSLWGEPVTVEVNRKGQHKLAMWEQAWEQAEVLSEAEWQRGRARDREQARRRAGNPLLEVYGAGPDGALCKSCMHLVRVRYHDRTYYKCELRGYSHGRGTDQRVGWPACGRYVRREGGESGDVRRVEVW